MTTSVRRPRVIYTNPSRAALPKPEASGRERFWWYFMRFSGLALVILALGPHVHHACAGRSDR